MDLGEAAAKITIAIALAAIGLVHAHAVVKLSTMPISIMLMKKLPLSHLLQECIGLEK